MSRRRRFEPRGGLRAFKRPSRRDTGGGHGRTVSTTTDESPSNAEMEALASELGGEFDGSETELE
jgi:hypothetical protein